MMTNRGIFETFPGNVHAPAPSPFTAVPESAPAYQEQPSAPAAPASPFKPSPFTVIDEADERPVEPHRPTKLPEKRKPESPFQIAEPTEGFGAMPTTQQGIPFNPYETSYGAPFAAPYGNPASPFTVAGAAPDYNPFAAAQATQAYPQAYPQPFAFQPAYQQPTFAPPVAYQTAPPAAPTQSFALTSDSSSIRQLELRAIFGVDREMGVDEILQRCRSLPGIRNIACLGGQEADTIESLKSVLAKLGYGGGALRIYAGQVPVEFIREGHVLLAVQTDGGFAPGVRETLMIVAREMSRLS